MDNEIFTERRFELRDEEVVARFYAPALAPGGEYQCRWEVQWPDKARRRQRRACGIDGVQALMLAMKSVWAELVESEEYRSGELTYLNERDLDLPPMWGAGPLDDPEPKPD